MELKDIIVPLGQIAAGSAKQTAKGLGIIGGAAIKGAISTSDKLTGTVRYERQEKPQAFQNMSYNDWKDVAATIFGEADATEPQIRAVASVILNRAKALNKSPGDVVRQMGSRGIPQFNAYGGDQFKRFKTGLFDQPSKQKAEIVNKILGEMRTGEFKDVTDGAHYFKHNKKGEIEIDKNKPLFVFYK